MRWSNGIIYLTRRDPVIEAELDKLYPRLPGLLQWRSAVPGILQKAASFVKSVSSGFASKEVIEERLKSCNGCHAMKMDQFGNKFCAACSCGSWQLAKLDGEVLPKLAWAHLDCPLHRKGFSNSWNM